jgi:hypothetical protein
LEVYRDFLKFCVDRSHSLDMICWPWAPRNLQLPTWIPNLSKAAFQEKDGKYSRVHADPLSGRPGVGFKPYYAAKGYPASWIPNDDKECLIVKGFAIDTIAEVSEKSPGLIEQAWLDASEWHDTKQTPPDTFWRTLVGNRDSQGRRPPGVWRGICRDVFDGRPAGGILKIEAMKDAVAPIVREFLERVYCVTLNRRLVLFRNRAASESVGLAPVDVRKDDVVCILYGCSVPVLLRKVENGGQEDSDIKVQYEFVGECYVHGVMDGEAFSQDMNEEDFELK